MKHLHVSKPIALRVARVLGGLPVERATEVLPAAREALRQANIIQKRQGRTNHKLILRWVAGHEGIEGNEAADSEAKKAANGLSSSKPLLPAYLRRTLPMNPATIRQHHNEKLTRTWTSEWKDVIRGKVIN